VKVKVLKLGESAKELELDVDINEYLSFEVNNHNHPDIEITTRMLLAHTSSIRDYNISRFIDESGDSPIDLDYSMVQESETIYPTQEDLAAS